MQGNHFVNGATAGFLLGLVMSVFQRLRFDIAYQQVELVGLGIVLLMTLAFQLVTLHFTDRSLLRDFVTRLRVMLLGTIFMAITYGIVSWLNLALIDNDYLAENFERYRNEILARGGPADAIAEAREFVAANKAFMLDPFKQAMLAAGTLLGVGGMTGVLLALFRRRDTF